jgi:hypothetical protein
MGMVEVKVSRGDQTHTLSCFEEWLIDHTQTFQTFFNIDELESERLEDYLRTFSFIENIVPTLAAGRDEMIAKWNQIHRKHFKKVRLPLITEKPYAIVSFLESLQFDEAIWLNRNELYRYFEIHAHNNDGAFIFVRNEDGYTFEVYPPAFQEDIESYAQEFFTYVEAMGIESFIRFFEKMGLAWSV